MDKIFFSKNNFNLSLNIISDKIYKKYQIDISQQGIFSKFKKYYE